MTTCWGQSASFCSLWETNFPLSSLARNSISMGEFEKALDLCVTDYPEFSLGKLCPIPQEPTEIHVHKAMWVEEALETFPAVPSRHSRSRVDPAEFHEHCNLSFFSFSVFFFRTLCSRNLLETSGFSWKKKNWTQDYFIVSKTSSCQEPKQGSQGGVWSRILDQARVSHRNHEHIISIWASFWAIIKANVFSSFTPSSLFLTLCWFLLDSSRP